MIPVAGSAYTYAYATLGEIFAWIIGWDLILEYAVSNMAVAVGFAAYFNDLFDNIFGFHFPEKLSRPGDRGRPIHRSVVQPARLPHLDGAELGAGAGVRESAGGEQRHGGRQAGRDPALRIWRSTSGEHFQLASLHAQRLSWRADRSRHRLLHLHRLRFGLHRRRGDARIRSAICPWAFY